MTRGCKYEFWCIEPLVSGCFIHHDCNLLFGILSFLLLYYQCYEDVWPYHVKCRIDQTALQKEFISIPELHIYFINIWLLTQVSTGGLSFFQLRQWCLGAVQWKVCACLNGIRPQDNIGSCQRPSFHDFSSWAVADARASMPSPRGLCPGTGFIYWPDAQLNKKPTALEIWLHLRNQGNTMPFFVN